MATANAALPTPKPKPPLAPGANVVVNGGFETPDVPSGSFQFFSGTAIAPWTVPDGQPLEIQDHAPGGGDAAEGQQLAELDASVATTMSQVLKTTPDTAYVLRFAYTPRPGTLPADNQLTVSWNGQVVSTQAPATVSSAMAWETIAVSVRSGLSRSSTLTFAATGGTSNGLGPYIDHVRVQPLTCETTKSGAYKSADTWTCPVPEKPPVKKVPGPGNDVIIKQPHVVKKTPQEDKASAKDLYVERGGQLTIEKQPGQPVDFELWGDLLNHGTVAGSSAAAAADLQLVWQLNQGQADELKKRIEVAEDDAQLDMIRLQALIQQQNQALELMTTLLKEQADLKLSITKNMATAATTPTDLLATATPDDDTTPFTLSTAGPFSMQGLEIGPGLAVTLGSGSVLTLEEFLQNDGELRVPALSSLTLDPGATVTGSGSFADTIAPTVTGLTVSPALNTATTATATVVDSPVDVLSATWDWGDGTPPTAGVVSSLDGTSIVTGEHVYDTVGWHEVTLTVRDSAGNEVTQTATAKVAYTFIGFAHPVDNGLVNVATAGRSLPLKWRLLDSAGAPVPTLGSATISTVGGGCGTGGSDVLEQYATGGSGLQNLGDGYYQLNWATPKAMAGTCQTLRLDLGEGTTAAPVHHVAQFRFR